MSYKTKQNIMNRVQKHHQTAIDLGYEVVGTFLQGSFNYGKEMSDDESDIDTKCLVLPTFEDICLNKKPHSTTHILPNNEHIDIKDLRLYIQCFKKQNINFVEILFTEYFVINPKYKDIFNRLIEHREEIGRYDIQSALNCMCGMAYEKKKALEHPYPATMDKIEKYGFDGKQLSHIMRIDDFMKRYIQGEEYTNCLVAKNPRQLLDVKRNKNISLDEARQLANELSNKMKIDKDIYLKENEPKVNKNIDKLFNEVLVDIMKLNFKEGY